MSTDGPVGRMHEHVASLRRYALVLTRNGDEAEDLVQECLTRAIAGVDGFEPGTNLRTWLFRILHNAWMSRLRKRKVRDEARAELPEPVAEAAQPLRVELRQVLDALDELPEHQRAPIVLVALEDMSYAEAARSLDVPLGTFMSRLGRGREALRKLVNGIRRPKLRLVA